MSVELTEDQWLAAEDAMWFMRDLVSERYTETIEIDIDSDLAARMFFFAHEKNVTPNELITLAIRQCVDNEGEGSDDDDIQHD